MSYRLGSTPALPVVLYATLTAIIVWFIKVLLASVSRYQIFYSPNALQKSAKTVQLSQVPSAMFQALFSISGWVLPCTFHLPVKSTMSAHYMRNMVRQALMSSFRYPRAGC